MSFKSKKQNNNFVPFASKKEICAAIALACFNILILAILCEIFKVPTILLAIPVVLLYLGEIALLGFYRKNSITEIPEKNIHEFLSEKGSVIIKNETAPIIALDRFGTILWFNASMQQLLYGEEVKVGDNIDKIFESGLNVENFENAPLLFHNKKYITEGFTVSESGKGLYIAKLTDVTDFEDLNKRYIDERVAVAYIAIDNVEDILQYVHEKFRDAVSIVDNKLKEWAASVNGIIKPYDNDKYIMFFDAAHLEKCIENRFAILDNIRDTRVGDSVSITVSIGVSKIPGTLAEREAAAREAIDMALQRGGDQAAYKTENSIEYYGGRTKSVYKRSNVRSRTFTTQLSALIARADNVIIMGHKYGDFDSFGATVGVARLCMLCGVKTNIAVDMRDRNLEPCINTLSQTEMYSQMFVDNAEGLDLVSADTLVILVDHNTLERAQFADIAKKVNTVAIIDHHRKIEAMPEVVKLSYIEPSASSTCELVTEMLEMSLSSQNLLKEAADMLLAGILLDTKQFTRNTGTRTFAAAQYLRGAGASPSNVYNFFKTSASDLSKEARFHTSIITYNGNIAISACDGDTDNSYRIIASKAADKMLTLKGIDAAFTLVRIGDQIHISGRSNGLVNVQLILERLNGGGHFDVAGAQVISDSITAVLETLKASIDDYFES